MEDGRGERRWAEIAWRRPARTALRLLLYEDMMCSHSVARGEACKSAQSRYSRPCIISRGFTDSHGRGVRGREKA